MDKVAGSSYVFKPKSEDYYRNFKEAIKAKETFDSDDRKLKVFMREQLFIW